MTLPSLGSLRFLVLAIGALVTFGLWLVIVGPALASDRSLTVTVRDTDTPVPGATIVVADPQWRCSTTAMTDSEGTAALGAGFFDGCPDTYAIFVIPPAGRGDLPAFEHGELLDARESVIRDIAFPEPNLLLALDTPTVPALVELHVPFNDHGGFLSAGPIGTIGEEQPLALHLQKSINRSLMFVVRPLGGQVDYPAFSYIVSVSDGAFVLEQIDGFAAVTGDDTTSTVTFTWPEPGLIVQLLDGGDPVAHATINVERYINVDWERVGIPRATNASGQVGIPTPTPDGEYLLRIDPPHDSELVPFEFLFNVAEGSIVLPGDAVTDGAGVLLLTFPEPNFRVRFDVDGEQADGSVWFEMYRLFGQGMDRDWERPSTFGDAELNGIVQLAVRESGFYRIRFHPSSESRLLSFSYEFGVDDHLQVVHAEAVDVDEDGVATLSFPEPNMSFRLVADNEPIHGAWVDVQQLVDQGNWSYWEWTSHMAGSRSDGWVDLAVTDPGEYRLRIWPPYGSGLPTFTQDFDIDAEGRVVASGGGVASFLDGDLDFPAPDLFGVVTNNGVGVAQAWLQVLRWSGDEDYGYWASADMFADTNASGQFSMFVGEADETLRLRVAPPWNADGLSRFDVDFVFKQEGVELVDPPSNASVIDGSLQLTFPTPNLTGTVRLESVEGDVVPYAWVELQREVSDGGWTYWDWTDEGTSANHQGRFAMLLDIDDVSNYRLRVAPPWGSALVSFTRDLEENDLDAIEDGSLDVTLVFPEPNVTTKILHDDAGVRGAFVEVQSWDAAGQYWMWTQNFAQSTRDGDVQFNLDDGTYRLVVHPPFQRDDLVAFTTPEFVVGVGGPQLASELAFVAPNVRGQVRNGEEGVRWGWIWVESEDEGTGGFGVSTRADGSFALNLDEGSWTLTVFPGSGNASLAPLRVHAFVGDADLESWRYDTESGGPNKCDEGSEGDCLLDLNFADISNTMTGTVSDSQSNTVEGAFVEVASGGLTIATITDSHGGFAFALPEGTYEITVVHAADDVVESCTAADVAYNESDLALTIDTEESCGVGAG